MQFLDCTGGGGCVLVSVSMREGLLSHVGTYIAKGVPYISLSPFTKPDAHHTICIWRDLPVSASPNAGVENNIWLHVYWDLNSGPLAFTGSTLSH